MHQRKNLGVSQGQSIHGQKMNNSQPLVIITYFNYIHTHTHEVHADAGMHICPCSQRSEDSSVLSSHLPYCFALLCALTQLTLNYWASSPVLLPTLLLQMQADVSSFLYELQGTHMHGWCFYLWKTQCTFYWIFQNKFLGEQDHKPSLYTAFSKMEGLVITGKVFNKYFSNFSLKHNQ